MSHVPSNMDKSSKDKSRKESPVPSNKEKRQRTRELAEKSHEMLQTVLAELRETWACMQGMNEQIVEMKGEVQALRERCADKDAENRRLQAMYSGAGSGAGGVGSTATATAITTWSPGRATPTMPRKRAQSEEQTVARMPPMKRARVAGEVRTVFRCSTVPEASQSAVPKASQKKVVQNQQHPKQGGGVVTLHLVLFEAVTKGVFPLFPEPYWIEIDTAELVRMGKSVRDRIPGSRGAEVCEAYKEMLGGSIYYMNQKGGDRDYEEVMVEGIGDTGYVEAKKILQGGRKFSREMTYFYVDVGTQLPVKVHGGRVPREWFGDQEGGRTSADRAVVLEWVNMTEKEWAGTIDAGKVTYVVTDAKEEKDGRMGVWRQVNDTPHQAEQWWAKVGVVLEVMVMDGQAVVVWNNNLDKRMTCTYNPPIAVDLENMFPVQGEERGVKSEGVPVRVKEEPDERDEPMGQVMGQAMGQAMGMGAGGPGPMPVQTSMPMQTSLPMQAPLPAPTPAHLSALPVQEPSVSTSPSPSPAPTSQLAPTSTNQVNPPKEPSAVDRWWQENYA